MTHIKDRVIVITGAAGGFGQLVAIKAAKLSASVVCADVDSQGLDVVVADIQAGGGQALGVKADVSCLEDMSALVVAAVEKFGRVDVLINNAGIMPLAFFEDHKLAADAWSRCIDINFKGVLNGISAAYDQMIEQNRGHIINVSSIYGNYPVRGAAVYGATKAAVNFLSESLRQETQGRIKVTTVRPTGVPNTGIGSGVINAQASRGLMGENADTCFERLGEIYNDCAPPAWTDSNNIEYLALAPELLADQIIYAIDQPWGVSISDMTIRASGDLYMV